MRNGLTGLNKHHVLVIYPAPQAWHTCYNTTELHTPTKLIFPVYIAMYISDARSPLHYSSFEGIVLAHLCRPQHRMTLLQMNHPMRPPRSINGNEYKFSTKGNLAQSDLYWDLSGGSKRLTSNWKLYNCGWTEKKALYVIGAFIWISLLTTDRWRKPQLSLVKTSWTLINLVGKVESGVVK